MLYNFKQFSESDVLLNINEELKKDPNKQFTFWIAGHHEYSYLTNNTKTIKPIHVYMLRFDLSLSIFEFYEVSTNKRVDINIFGDDSRHYIISDSVIEISNEYNSLIKKYYDLLEQRKQNILNKQMQMENYFYNSDIVMEKLFEQQV